MPAAAGPFRLLNHSFEVICTSASMAAAITFALTDNLEPDATPEVRYRITDTAGRLEVHTDGGRVRAADDEEGVVDALCTEANLTAVRSSTAPAVLHAGAVAADGVAVVIAGRSGSGKTTAVRRMMADGWAYLTDEAVQIDTDLQTLPYIKPLVIKDHVEADGRVRMRRQHLPPSTLGSVCRTPTPVAGIVLLDVADGSPGRLVIEATRLAFPIGSARPTLEVMAALVRERGAAAVPVHPDPGTLDAAVSDLLDRFATVGQP